MLNVRLLNVISMEIIVLSLGNILLDIFCLCNLVIINIF